MAQQKPPERTGQREQQEFHEQLHRAAGNGGEGGTRGGIDPRRHTENAPSRRYRLLIALVAVAFVAIVVYLIVDAVAASD